MYIPSHFLPRNILSSSKKGCVLTLFAQLGLHHCVPMYQHIDKNGHCYHANYYISPCPILAYFGYVV